MCFWNWCLRNPSTDHTGRHVSAKPTRWPLPTKTAGENKKNGVFLTSPSSFVKTQFWQLVLARASRRVPRAAVGASEVMDYSWDVQGKWHSLARRVAHSAAGRHDRAGCGKLSCSAFRACNCSWPQVDYCCWHWWRRGEQLLRHRRRSQQTFLWFRSLPFLRCYGTAAGDAAKHPRWLPDATALLQLVVAAAESVICTAATLLSLALWMYYEMKWLNEPGMSCFLLLSTEGVSTARHPLLIQNTIKAFSAVAVALWPSGIKV